MVQIIKEEKNNSTVETLTTLFKEGKLDEAKTLINSLVQRELTSREKGELYVNFLSMYMDVVNSLNQEYKLFLQQTLASLKDIKKAEKKVEEDIKIEEVRTGLQ
jgi:methanogenic corrinoid protein MtbC1